jgi:hypothetical protein
MVVSSGWYVNLANTILHLSLDMISQPFMLFVVQLCGRFKQSGGSELWGTWGTDNQEEKSRKEEHKEHTELSGGKHKDHKEPSGGKHKYHKEQSGGKKQKDKKEAPTLWRWLSENQV